MPASQYIVYVFTIYIGLSASFLSILYLQILAKVHWLVFLILNNRIEFRSSILHSLLILLKNAFWLCIRP